MKASCMKILAQGTSYDEIIDGEQKKRPTIKARRKGDASRHSLDQKLNERPLYKGEILTDKFLND